MDRHLADTLAWRFVEIQAQKKQLKGWLNVWYQWAGFDWSPRDGLTLGRHARMAIC